MKKPKDYERLYECCRILDAYVEREYQSDYNLNPDHDVICLCFNVDPEDLEKGDAETLEANGCTWSSEYGTWKMNISC